MKERPILFSPPMVRCLLKDRKTKTRRIMKMTENAAADVAAATAAGARFVVNDGGSGTDPAHFVIRTKADVRYHAWCPYGGPGDRLWVKETHARGTTNGGDRPWVVYRATHAGDLLASDGGRVHWKPSIHMPRWASRITLEITDVQVERLQDINHADSRAEGEGADGDGFGPGCFYRTFSSMWEALHGRGAWDANPWLWVLTFKRVA